MSKPNDSKSRPIAGWLLFLVAGIGVFALGMLASSITERRAETVPARLQFMQPIADFEADNAKWGQSFPREYNSWESTKDTNENSKYGGSGFRDYLEEDPRLVVMWAGYPFAKEFNQARGHYHSVDDVTGTKRIDEKTPGTCWTCKSPDVPRMMEKVGIEQFYSGKFAEFKPEIKNPIGCADCHDNKTMQLRISRPALVEAFDRQGKDISKATHQEMRSLVCAQCHVEYYFKGDKKYLTFPWDEGFKAEDFEKYYEKNEHVDWTHAVSGAKMIKMQHPDYEVYQQGIHAFRGVSCADCHMPYRSEGGIKFTDHQIRSPLYNIQNACGVCHKWSEKEVIGRVESIQDKNKELLAAAQDAITRAHLEIGDAKKLGATDAELDGPRKQISKAQMFWDYVAANNGMGFHAPQECARVLAKATNYAQMARIEVAVIRARFGAGPFAMPDLGSKAKAQEFIGLFVESAKAKTAATTAAPAPAPAPEGASAGRTS